MGESFNGRTRNSKFRYNGSNPFSPARHFRVLSLTKTRPQWFEVRGTYK